MARAGLDAKRVSFVEVPSPTKISRSNSLSSAFRSTPRKASNNATLSHANDTRTDESGRSEVSSRNSAQEGECTNRNENSQDGKDARDRNASESEGEIGHNGSEDDDSHSSSQSSTSINDSEVSSDGKLSKISERTEKSSVFSP
ncbi:hypothetical protein AB6A40_003442 [Gnathostoma spinigerum]|uniref:Uncharacterized protein n=1 Tax=Gnathostoma spinigerum TaxID=75299 RepID=A0ABD6E9K8_9BILA